MQIKIGKKAYSSNPAMITLIRYYVEFRESFLAAYLSGACGALELARLAWSSIDGPKPDFDTFLVAAAESRGFAAAARSIQAAILASPRVEGGGQTSTNYPERTDEFDILALMTIAGIDVGLIHVLPIFYIVEIASRKTATLSNYRDTPKRRFYLMSEEEIREEYGRR